MLIVSAIYKSGETDLTIIKKLQINVSSTTGKHLGHARISGFL
jgi:hypothetical protein